MRRPWVHINISRTWTLDCGILTSVAIAQLVILGFVFFMLLSSAASMVYVERKVAARIQQRMGPTLVGPYGLLQPLADIIKLAMKEDLRPKSADPILFALAPDYFRRHGVHGICRRAVRRRNHVLRPARSTRAPWGRRYQRRDPVGVCRDLDGGLRHRARRLELEQQVLAPRRAALVCADDQLRALIWDGPRGGAAARGLDVASRDRRCSSGAWFGFIPRWFVFLQPIGFFIFMTAGVAETNRAPFDFPEAEQELVAGYHTEYSSMSFAMFFLAEYINMVTVSAIATNLYLGGWHGPLLPVWLGWIWFLLKVASCCSSMCGCDGRCRAIATIS